MVLSLLTAAVVLTVAGSIWWQRRGGPAEVVALGPAPPEMPRPASPPPVWRGELAALDAPSADGAPAARIEQRLKGVTSAVSLLRAQVQKLPVDGTASGSLLVLPGDARATDAISRIPRHERWEIQFPPGNTIDSYSRQLDFFKIELGVIGDSDKVVYLTNLSAPTPAARSESAASDRRIYLIWQRGALREAAEELASRAKVDSRGKVLAHFCPAELEKKLADLEDEFARQKAHRQVRKTIFGIKSNDAGGYVFYVIDQKAGE